MRYRADQLLRSVELDELTAIYHRSSGMTHVVAEPVPEILAALDREVTLEELAERLGVDDCDALAERLNELVEAGLVATA